MLHLSQCGLTLPPTFQRYVDNGWIRRPSYPPRPVLLPDHGIWMGSFRWRSKIESAYPCKDNTNPDMILRQFADTVWMPFADAYLVPFADESNTDKWCFYYEYAKDPAPSVVLCYHDGQMSQYYAPSIEIAIAREAIVFCAEWLGNLAPLSSSSTTPEGVVRDFIAHWCSTFLLQSPQLSALVMELASHSPKSRQFGKQTFESIAWLEEIKEAESKIPTEIPFGTLLSIWSEELFQ